MAGGEGKNKKCLSLGQIPFCRVVVTVVVIILRKDAGGIREGQGRGQRGDTKERGGNSKGPG